MRLKSVDLFCGSGGMSVGLQDAEIDVVAAYDAWKPAVETYCQNIDCHAYELDLSDTKEAIKRVSDHAPDLIVGGPPCQDFSTAGHRVEGDRANLTLAFGKIVLGCKPDFFLMENVPQARLSRTYSRMAARMRNGGYEIAELVLNASLYGVPQNRRRFFSFGSLRNGIANKWLCAVQEREAKDPMTVKEYLRKEIDINHYYRHPRNYSRRSVFSVHEPSPTIRGVNRPVPPNYQGNHLDSVPPSTVRPLTSYERSRIQTFPKKWKWAGNDRNADVELQIGNAVPPNLALAVGGEIKNVAR